MTGADAGELASLSSAAAVRERAEALFGLAERRELEHFALRLELLPALAERVAASAARVYRTPLDVPLHGRYRHFESGGVPRLAELTARLAGRSASEQLAARADLVIVSVLLDAGAGPAWSYREAETGLELARSEGLGVASFRWFTSGGLSADPARDPLRVDAERLASLARDELARAFMVTPDNPLVGLDGRLSLLRRLGDTMRARPDVFGPEPRPGNLALRLLERARDGAISAPDVLRALLVELGPIWPGRENLGGVNLGDVWTHSRHGRVPFHKLSQWLSYSLCEPLERAGARVRDLDGLTGLAEYRNGGLFLDGGVVVPRRPALLDEVHGVGSDVVIEWRALTVALLDRIAGELRRLWRLDRERLPLGKVLEAGTWRAGRELARERRADGSPPIRIDSDGTVF